MERVGGEHGGVTMGGRQAAELGLYLVGADARRFEDRGSLGQLRHQRRPQLRSRRTPPAQGDPFNPAVGDEEGDSKERRRRARRPRSR